MSLTGYNIAVCAIIKTDLHGTVAKSSANGLVGFGFTS